MLYDPPVTSPSVPTYCEAYPALKLRSVRAAAQAGLSRCEWHNEKLDLVASLELIEWTDISLDVVTYWSDRDTEKNRRDVFDLLRHMTETRKLVPDALCEGCERAQAVLYLKEGEWRCARCHDLAPLSTLLTTDEKRLVRARGLHFDVYGREPPVRGFRTYEYKRMQLMMLTAKVEKAGVWTLREHLRARVGQQWLESYHDADEDDPLVKIAYAPGAGDIPAVHPWFG